MLRTELVLVAGALLGIAAVAGPSKEASCLAHDTLALCRAALR